ncbi:BQ2448_1918 [Microbotryum intermedium]|uniref:BQ2448_1918 protein n=1 Tax=Microbotryum intermedium TaxID=269621 RepID=A0A238FF76_9BASI|nr:BQ2448_1918 [Microbotryum intermedium]
MEEEAAPLSLQGFTNDLLTVSDFDSTQGQNAALLPLYSPTSTIDPSSGESFSNLTTSFLMVQSLSYAAKSWSWVNSHPDHYFVLFIHWKGSLIRREEI